MNDYIFFMHDDARGETSAAWAEYLAKLRATGRFNGGSAIGGGACVRKSGAASEICKQLTGYLRIEAENLDEAKRLLEGNPTYESGGTVEIRELPRD